METEPVVKENSKWFLLDSNSHKFIHHIYTDLKFEFIVILNFINNYIVHKTLFITRKQVAHRNSYEKSHIFNVLFLKVKA